MDTTPHTVEVDVKVRNVEFEGVTIRPGDHVLVRVPTHTSLAEIDQFREQLADRFPEITFTCVAAEQLVIVKGGEQCAP